jgi:hypothetical protein
MSSHLYYGDNLGVLRKVRASRLPYPKAGGAVKAYPERLQQSGDVVLDPFCGCGTTVHAAQKLGRSWIGIDVTHLAIGLALRDRSIRLPAKRDDAFRRPAREVDPTAQSAFDL